MRERTLLIIKPDAVERRIAGEIIKRIEASGFDIIAMEKILLSKKEAVKFYDVHSKKEFFHGLVDFMTSGRCIPMVIEGENVVEGIRQLIGKTDPEKAEKGTIRSEYGTTIRRNCVHASDSSENAAREISFFYDLRSLLL